MATVDLKDLHTGTALHLAKSRIHADRSIPKRRLHRFDPGNRRLSATFAWTQPFIVEHVPGPGREVPNLFLRRS